jgi:4-hydroxyproline epimerase
MGGYGTSATTLPGPQGRAGGGRGFRVREARRRKDRSGPFGLSSRYARARMSDRAETPFPESLRVVDAHTEGEPTRVVVEGWPAFSARTPEGRRDEVVGRFDALRAGVVLEPRGHDAMVAAILAPPIDPSCDAGVVFCNNAGALGMCGHGLMGVARVLERLGRLKGPRAVVETPAGRATATLGEGGFVEIENVRARLFARDVEVNVAGVGVAVGDVAYGGNWFFLARTPPPLPLRPDNTPELLRVSEATRAALVAAGIRGEGGAEIDHVEWFERSSNARVRNFTLCPGGAYDRSPCGTGSSAKAASLVARGELRVGETLRVESIVGGVFDVRMERRGADLTPIVRGRAFVTAESKLIFDPSDPFRAGLPRG